MKFISFIIIAIWSLWVVFTHGDMTLRENPLLWFLGALSWLYVVINAVIFLVEWQHKKTYNGL